MRIHIDDEIKKENTHFHMERMSDGHIWFTLGDTAFDLYAEGSLLSWIPQGKSWQELEDISVVASDSPEK